eukprot:1156674-Pelagomonas_calceolata.AAC.12
MQYKGIYLELFPHPARSRRPKKTREGGQHDCLAQEETLVGQRGAEGLEVGKWRVVGVHT